MDRYVSIHQLRDVYGLTPSMIAQLGPPDRRTRLYLTVRVEAFVAAHEYQMRSVAPVRNGRSARHRRKWTGMYYKAVGWAARCAIDFTPPESVTEAFRRADAWYRDLDASQGIPYQGTSPARFAAWLRHHHTNYERLVRGLTGCTGSADACEILRERAHEVVSAWLAEQRADGAGRAHVRPRR